MTVALALEADKAIPLAAILLHETDTTLAFVTGGMVGIARETDTAFPVTLGILALAREIDTALAVVSGGTVGAWPFDDLKPRHIGIYPCAATIGGGVALTRKEPAIDSGAGYWRIEYGSIPITSRALILLWRKMELLFEGRARVVSIPIYDGKRAPWLGAPGGAITATANASAAVGATSMSINVTSGGVLKKGMHFSIVGRLHRIIGITSTVGSVYGVNIWPKLREDVASGTALEFRRPTCRVRLASDDGMALNLELLRFGDPSVTFEEAL